MAYKELIKNFDHIRGYMREFFVYGFKSREEFGQKSARSYDDERRRVESWLGDYMTFKRTAGGKNLFLSIDSRLTRHNPLYEAWKAKSFTDGDITLHFILFDILHDPSVALTLKEISEKADGMLREFDDPRLFDESSIRKKLKEYTEEGIIETEKQGRTVLYRRAADTPLCSAELMDFASEVMPCGVVGSFLLDKLPPHKDRFAFKHHYITGALDSEIVCALLTAIGEKRRVTLRRIDRFRGREKEMPVIPLRLMLSAQTGRQYLMLYDPRMGRIRSARTDSILSVTMGEVAPEFDEKRALLDSMQEHMWGVGTQSRSGDRMEHVEFTVTYRDDEEHIHQRLEREKRCGTVERIDAHTSRFSADVYDASELIPWIRTFLCRITELRFSDPEIERQFRDDLNRMYRVYDLEGGGEA